MGYSPSAKCACYYLWICKRGGNPETCIRRETYVCMQKQQHVASREQGSSIHLSRASASRAESHYPWMITDNLQSPIRAAAIDHDDLMKIFARR